MLLALLVGCGGAARTDTLRSPLDVTELDGLGRCDEQTGVSLERGRPLTILVHGNHAAVDAFATLASALEVEGEQVVCYRWREGGRLTYAAQDLREALEALDRLGLPRIRVLGHSLGGLAARRALTTELGAPLETPIELVTVATPFAGVASAKTCGLVWARVLSLGAVGAICRRLARGAKWRDIHPQASLIREPGELGPWVTRHVHVVTEEHGHCRRRAPDGRCAKDDHVFDVEEQATTHIEDPRVEAHTMNAGHGAVVMEPEAVAELVRLLSESATESASASELAVYEKRGRSLRSHAARSPRRSPQPSPRLDCLRASPLEARGSSPASPLPPASEST